MAVTWRPAQKKESSMTSARDSILAPCKFDPELDRSRFAEMKGSPYGITSFPAD